MSSATDEPTRLVVVGDVVRSRALTAEARRAVQARVRALGDEGLAFRFSGGDEFEWALPDTPEALDRLLRLRLQLGLPEGEAPAVDLRCGIGRGAVTVRSAEGPYAEDGPAYHRARAAMNALRAPPAPARRSSAAPLAPASPTIRRTAWVDAAPHPERDALLLHMDRLLTGWSTAQRAAIVAVLAGATYRDVARAAGISPQAVQSRLRSADLSLYLVGHAALKHAWSRA